MIISIFPYFGPNSIESFLKHIDLPLKNPVLSHFGSNLLTVFEKYRFAAQKYSFFHTFGGLVAINRKLCLKIMFKNYV